MKPKIEKRVTRRTRAMEQMEKGQAPTVMTEGKKGKKQPDKS